MTHDDLIALIRQKCREAGTQAEAAKAWHVTAGYISDVINGRRDPGPKLLDAIGYQRIVAYQPTERKRSGRRT